MTRPYRSPEEVVFFTVLYNLGGPEADHINEMEMAGILEDHEAVQVMQRREEEMGQSNARKLTATWGRRNT